MSNLSPPIRALALQILAAELHRNAASGAQSYDLTRLCEELRTVLEPWIGAESFVALLRRAKALANADLPALQNTQVTADGRLQRTPGVPVAGGKDNEEAISITGHLLGLLIILIGESLTLSVLRKAFPMQRIS